jgi:hypothetical protein
MDHDQNFKNLILDYPRQALALFAEAEAGALPEDVRITPIRQEQLKEVGGQCFTFAPVIGVSPRGSSSGERLMSWLPIDRQV